MNPLVIARAKRNGIVQPVVAWTSAQKAGIPYFVACAFLVQESSGGHNVYGSDAGQQFGGAGTVTEDNYRIYRLQRDREHACGRRYGNQGVGPMQLTAATLQDAADAAGGCWRPAVNMQTAFAWLAELRETEGSWHDAARRYNGSEEYADRMDERFAEWRDILKVRER